MKKLEGLPKIIYLNSKHDSDRDKWIRNHFDSLNIENYERYEKEYTTKDIDEGLTKSQWLELIGDDNINLNFENLRNTLDHYNAIVKWFDTTDEDVCILMDDIVDFSIAKYWYFNWETFYNKLPYNWDCIQLFVNSSNEQIRTYLHPWIPTSRSTRCYMITRQFAKKLKHLHYKDGKFHLYNGNKDRSHSESDEGNIEVTLFDLGVTYSCPLVSIKRDYVESDELNVSLCRDRLSADAIKHYWENMSMIYSTEEFLSYGFDRDWKRVVTFDMKSEYVDNTKQKMLIWI
tara:strand:+ start:599 stop:1462 length:864 start_codon:yes stop_codon:yes gene_type:complete